MGQLANAKRSAIKSAFEAASGDVKGDVEPVFISARATKKDVLRAEVKPIGDTLDVRYWILDDELDDADVARVVHIAYLDVLTSHYWKNKVGGRYARTHLRLTNADSGSTTTMRYPDPE